MKIPCFAFAFLTASTLCLAAPDPSQADVAVPPPDQPPATRDYLDESRPSSHAESPHAHAGAPASSTRMDHSMHDMSGGHP